MSDPQKILIADYPDFAAIALHYLHSQNIQPEIITEFRLSLGDRNLWNLDAKKLAEILPKAIFKKRNDFEANALGIFVIDGTGLLPLLESDGNPSEGASCVVIGVGTGLGLAYIMDGPNGPFIQRTHGGHMVPATITAEQTELFGELQKFKSDGTVAIYEDLISGPGLWNMYCLACEKAHTHREYFDTNDMLVKGGNDPLVQNLLCIFHEMLGLFAHQAVMFGFSFGGIYLTGGILDRLVGQNLWDGERFLKSFRQKNVPIVLKDIEATPIYWIKDEFIALSGLLRDLE
jgi:glucokinase